MNTILLFLFTCLTLNIAAIPIKIKSIYDVMIEDPYIKFHKHHDPISFEHKSLPVAEYSYFHPNKGCFDQTGVFVIPNGKAYITDWYLIYDQQDHILKEFIPTSYSLLTHLQNVTFENINQKNLKHIPGKVAVITGLAYENYGHWLGEILARLQILKQQNIKYDWLYIPHVPTFCKEILSLLEIDTSKLLQPHSDYIQAETLIVPTLPARFIPQQNDTNYAYEHFATLYIPGWHIEWLRKTFIPKAEQQFAQHEYCDKIFISRKDAPVRAILNEDELFSYFEQKGFKRYNLTNMSVLEQVHLFNQATYIISGHGAGLTNILFCNRNACIIEIFQNQFDATFWYISQSLQLEHHCIKTQDLQPICRKSNTHIPLEIIKNYMNKHLPYV